MNRDNYGKTLTPEEAALKYQIGWVVLNKAKEDALARADFATARDCRQQLSYLSVECEARHSVGIPEEAKLPSTKWVVSVEYDLAPDMNAILAVCSTQELATAFMQRQPDYNSEDVIHHIDEVANYE